MANPSPSPWSETGSVSDMAACPRGLLYVSLFVMPDVHALLCDRLLTGLRAAHGLKCECQPSSARVRRVLPHLCNGLASGDSLTLDAQVALACKKAALHCEGGTKGNVDDAGKAPVGKSAKYPVSPWNLDNTVNPAHSDWLARDRLFADICAHAELDNIKPFVSPEQRLVSHGSALRQAHSQLAGFLRRPELDIDWCCQYFIAQLAFTGHLKDLIEDLGPLRDKSLAQRIDVLDCQAITRALTERLLSEFDFMERMLRHDTLSELISVVRAAPAKRFKRQVAATLYQHLGEGHNWKDDCATLMRQHAVRMPPGPGDTPRESWLMTIRPKYVPFRGEEANWLIPLQPYLTAKIAEHCKTWLTYGRRCARSRLAGSEQLQFENTLPSKSDSGLFDEGTAAHDEVLCVLVAIAKTLAAGSTELLLGLQTVLGARPSPSDWNRATLTPKVRKQVSQSLRNVVATFVAWALATLESRSPGCMTRPMEPAESAAAIDILRGAANQWPDELVGVFKFALQFAKARPLTTLQSEMARIGATERVPETDLLWFIRSVFKELRERPVRDASGPGGAP